MSVNKYGLSREIPEGVKREIRQRSGFGCVICGLGLYEYEHVLPEFSEATEHDPQRMCLLCPNHHSRVTKSQLSKDKVLSAMSSPKALHDGFSHDHEFSFLERPLKVLLGQVEFQDPGVLIQHGTDPLIWFSEKDERLVFNAKFFNQNGELILEVIENEWRNYVGNWDVTQIGAKLKINGMGGIVSLTVNCVSKNEIRFDYLNMYIDGHRFKSQKNRPINIETQSGAGFFGNAELKTKGPIVFRADGGFEIRGGMMVRGGQIRGSQSR